MKRQRHSPSRSEAGFALLFVYAMAATVAITLLLQLPSAAFEAQRDREQLLIDRGEQYSRAIQLYVRKFNSYPANFDALDNTQNLRFLRHHYEDPLTGKDEWRLIHVGPGGVFIDSVLYTKKKDPNQAEKQTFITELPMVADPSTGTQGVNIATRRNGSGGYNPNDPNSPLPGQQGSVLPGQQAFPGGQNAFPGQTGQFGDPNQTQQYPGGLPPGVQFPPGTQPPPGVQMPGQSGSIPGQSGSMPGSVPGTSAGGAATSLINQLLTTPRPGGLGGVNTTGTPQTSVDAFGNPVGGTATGGLQAGAPGQPAAAQGAMAAGSIGGGIAGIASKLEQEGIKRYRDRKLYNEWEFVYDITKDASRGGAPGQQPQQQQQQQQQGAAGANPASTTAPTNPGQAAPAPVNPAPVNPPPMYPNPVNPNPVNPNPVNPNPVNPNPVNPNPVNPVPPITPLPVNPAPPPITGGVTSGSIGVFPSLGQAPAQPSAPSQPVPGQPGFAPANPGIPGGPNVPPGTTLPPGVRIPGSAPPQQ